MSHCSTHDTVGYGDNPSTSWGNSLKMTWFITTTYYYIFYLFLTDLFFSLSLQLKVFACLHVTMVIIISSSTMITTNSSKCQKEMAEGIISSDIINIKNNLSISVLCCKHTLALFKLFANSKTIRYFSWGTEDNHKKCILNFTWEMSWKTPTWKTTGRWEEIIYGR